MYRSRQKEQPMEVELMSTPTPTPLGSIRGRCSLCGDAVYDTQARRKDADTGLYQHEACCTGDGVPVQPDAVAAAKARASVDVSNNSTNPTTAEQATAAVAAAAAEAQAEVAAIIAAGDAARVEAIAEANRQATAATAAVAMMAATDAARAEVTADTNRQAQAAGAHTQANAAHIVATADGNDVGDTAASVVSASTQPPPTQGGSVSPASRPNPVLPAVTRTAPLLPDGKHAFLSYQWDVQAQVVQIKALLNERSVKCWMDIDGGMKTDIYDSVSMMFRYSARDPPTPLSRSPPPPPRTFK